jgi:LysR family transcriptional regulator, transcriptional activator of the cysJI operon
VSQHIKSLESDLRLKLFTRVGRQIVPTPIASEIFPDIEAAFVRVQARLGKLAGGTPEPEGIIRIGMPIEFGSNILVGKLAELGKKYKKLTFEITLDFAGVLHQQLLQGQLDFAFVDEIPVDRRLAYSPVATESLLLCAHRDYVQSMGKVTYTQSYFEKLEYIEYKGSEPILRRWMLHHLKRKNLNLNVRAHIIDVRGIAKFISSGLGAGVLPDHVVTRLKTEGVDLHVFEGRAPKPVRNEIRLVQLKGHDLPSAAKVTFNELKAMFG